MGDAARRLGWDDYLAFPDDGVRRQILEGEVAVSPSPRIRHQRLVFWLGYRLHNFLEGTGLGEALLSPLSVRLPCGDVVEPDVVFVAAGGVSTEDEMGIIGPPDLLIEVLSPSNRRHDLLKKRRIYEAAGVSEYWIVDPEGECVTRLALEGTRYIADGPVFAAPGATVSTPVLPGFELDVAALFAQTEPR